MAQINLLKQSKSETGTFEGITKIVVWIFWIVLAGLVAWYVILYIDTKSVSSKILEKKEKIAADEKVGLEVRSRNEIFTRQAQLKTLQGLVNQHLYWSQLLPELARVTLKASGYKSISVNSGGEISLNVTAPSLYDLDKFMQVFDLPEFNKNFSNVRIGGYNKVQGETSSTIQFQVKMNFDPKLVQYQDKTSK